MVALTEQMVRGKTRMEKMSDVRNLNLWGQDLDDVSMIKGLENVEILSLSVNSIATLRDFRHCKALQELYLRKNEVGDIAELQYLTPLRDLKVLWLSDNPCADHPYYRQLAVRVLPSLLKLDSAEVTEFERQQAMCNPELDKYLAMPLDPEGPRPASRPLSSMMQPHGEGGSPMRGGGSHSRGGSPHAGMKAGGGGQGGGGSRNKNILYAVMALVAELDADDLVYVRREIEQRLASGG